MAWGTGSVQCCPRQCGLLERGLGGGHGPQPEAGAGLDPGRGTSRLLQHAVRSDHLTWPQQLAAQLPSPGL